MSKFKKFDAQNQIRGLADDAKQIQVEELAAGPCRRSNGTERAWFFTKGLAEKFAQDPANVHYHGNVAHECQKCGWFHLSRPSWLFPEWETMTSETRAVN